MRRILTILAVFLLVVYLSYPFILESAARFLIVADPLKKADAIVVVSGDSNGERIRQGAELYRQGLGKYFMVSGGGGYLEVTLGGLIRKTSKALGDLVSGVL